MLQNPNPDQFFELPDGSARKFEYVFLNIMTTESYRVWIHVNLYKDAEAFHNNTACGDFALGWVECSPSDPDLFDKAHDFALQTFAGFEKISPPVKEEENDQEE